MNIVVLDGDTMHGGDLSWDQLEALGTCTIYKKTEPAEVVERSAGAEALVTNKVVLDDAVLDQLPNLKYIGVSATGYNVVDVASAKRRGIVVTNVPTYATASVAQCVFALLLEMTHHVGHHGRTVRDGRWSACENFCYWDRPLIELEGLTMGLIGFGRIGRATARLAQAFSMRVIAHDIIAADSGESGVEFVSLDELFAQSDVVSLHCPLTDENHSLINAESLAQMKSTALLINTARGPLIDEHALADALAEGKIAGAGLDVLSAEPPTENNPLLTAPNCYITPHIAWATRSARQRLLTGVIENLRAFIAEKPMNVVNT